MDAIATQAYLPPTNSDALAKTRAIEQRLLNEPQVDIQTIHTIHAGVYTRTIKVPAEVAITGAFIKIPTTLVVNGECLVTIGDRTRHLTGHCVFCASGSRKQIFVALSDTWITMLFKTIARTVEEAEREFTDEYEMLASKKCNNIVTITED